jgi:hypothetical protein
MAEAMRCRIGIIVEKRESDNPWLDHEWVTSGVTLDVAERDDWTLLYQVTGVKRYLSPPVTLELFSQETEAYLYNLQSPSPSLFAVLREDEESVAEVPFDVHLVTASPYEAQDYLDSSEEHVDRINMDDAMRSWVKRFVDEHHQDEEFKKRKRDKVKGDEYKFGQEPIFELRKRTRDDGSGSLH